MILYFKVYFFIVNTVNFQKDGGHFTDFLQLQDTLIFIFGILTALGGAYAKMRTSGQVLYPIQKIEAGKQKIRVLTENNAKVGQLVELMGNISPEEANAIFEEAASRYDDGSFSALDAQVVGAMVFEAIKIKD